MSYVANDDHDSFVDDEGDMYDELMSEIITDPAMDHLRAEDAQNASRPTSTEARVVLDMEAGRPPRSPRKRRSPTPVPIVATRLRTKIKLTSDHVEGMLGSARQRAPRATPVPVTSTPKKPRNTRKQASAVAGMIPCADARSSHTPQGEALVADMSLPSIAVIDSKSQASHQDLLHSRSNQHVSLPVQSHTSPIPTTTSTHNEAPAIAPPVVVSPILQHLQPPSALQQQQLPLLSVDGNSPNNEALATGPQHLPFPPPFTTATLPPLLAPQQYQRHPISSMGGGNALSFDIDIPAPPSAPYAWPLTSSALPSTISALPSTTSALPPAQTATMIAQPWYTLVDPLPYNRVNAEAHLAPPPPTSSSSLQHTNSNVVGQPVTTSSPSPPKQTAAAIIVSESPSSPQQHNHDSSEGGRPTKEESAALQASFAHMDELLSAEIKRLSIPRDRYLKQWLKNDGRIASQPSHWNSYEQYFYSHAAEELARLPGPSITSVKEVDGKVMSECFKQFKAQVANWKEALNIFEELQVIGGAKPTFATRQRRFKIFYKKICKSLSAAANRDGFHSVFIACGNVVNQDVSLGSLFSSPDAVDFFKVRCGYDDSKIIGHFKAHVYNQASLKMVTDVKALHGDDDVPAPPAVNTTKPSRARKTIIKDATTDSADMKAIKDRFISMGVELGYIIPERQFPWQKMPKELTAAGLVLINWPEGVTLPGKARRGLANPKGIADLLHSEQIALLHQFDAEQHPCKFTRAEDPRALVNNTAAVVIGAPPPHDSHYTHGVRLFADGHTDRKGKLRLDTSGTTRVRLKGPSRQANQGGEQQAPLADSTQLRTRPITRATKARMNGNKTIPTKALASMLPAYSSDSEDRDYVQDEDDDEKQSSSKSLTRIHASDEDSNSTHSKSDSDDQPITRRLQSKNKGKAKARFLTPVDLESEDDVLITSPKAESLKRSGNHPPATRAKRRRVDSISSKESSVSSSVVEIERPASIVTLKPTSVAKPTSVTKPASVAKPTSTTKPISTTTKPISVIKPTSAMKPTSKVGALKPEVVIHRPRKAVVEKDPSTESDKTTATTARPRPKQVFRRLKTVEDAGSDSDTMSDPPPQDSQRAAQASSGAQGSIADELFPPSNPSPRIQIIQPPNAQPAPVIPADVHLSPDPAGPLVGPQSLQIQLGVVEPLNAQPVPVPAGAPLSLQPAAALVGPQSPQIQPGVVQPLNAQPVPVPAGTYLSLQPTAALAGPLALQGPQIQPGTVQPPNAQPASVVPTQFPMQGVPGTSQYPYYPQLGAFAPPAFWPGGQYPGYQYMVPPHPGFMGPIPGYPQTGYQTQVVSHPSAPTATEDPATTGP